MLPSEHTGCDHSYSLNCQMRPDIIWQDKEAEVFVYSLDKFKTKVFLKALLNTFGFANFSVQYKEDKLRGFSAVVFPQGTPVFANAVQGLYGLCMAGQNAASQGRPY